MVIYGRVFDKDGGVTNHSTTVVVNNIAPTAMLSNNGAINEGTSLTVTFSNTSDVSSVDLAAGFRYSFATSEAGLATTYAAAGLLTSASFLAVDNGTYVIYGRVFDKDNGFRDYSTTVVVNNVAPTVSLAVSPSASVFAGTNVTVSSTVQDPAGLNDPLIYSWVVTRDGAPFGQGSGGSYLLSAPAAGVYVVTLTVSDGDGGVTSASQIVTVAPVPNVPRRFRSSRPKAMC